MLPYSESSEDIDYEGHVFWNMMAFIPIEFTDISKVGAASVFRMEGRILLQNI
jgi:hypothetical protein